ncbi:hypothetical protein GALL_510190 [mine drainage metagenome]|uniref:Uncharacterized protein n=1 Tax=mine drainage metagenome TaxID=410659 RepID=A0A1J5PQ38_9ZZZZ
MDRHLDQVFEDCLVAPQVEGLEHHAKLAAGVFDLFAAGGGAIVAQHDFLAGDDDLAAGWGFKKVDAAQHRRFARAGPANDRDHVAFPRFQRDALQHFQRAKGFVEIVDDNCIATRSR